MNTRFARDPGWLVALWWLVLAVTVIALRPATVADETRYLSVAWEMHRSGDVLLLRLNGDLYGHKPPLLFWLIELGWRAFGVQLWWPRVLTAGFGLGAVYLVISLVRHLAPDRDDIASLTAFVTASSLVWILYCGAVMFDLMLAFFVLLALLNVVRAAAGAGMRAWLAAGVALGLAVLTKGPVALLHVLPVALLGPWWMREWRDAKVTTTGWYAGVGIAVVVAAALSLAWAIPASVVGGEAFGGEILWRQSAGRIATEGYHGRPFWFHAAMLPLLLLPWTLLPPFWRGIASAARRSPSVASRFALAWFVPVFLAFTAIKGKQLHYLLPEIPALALLAATGIDGLTALSMPRVLTMARGIGSAAIAAVVVAFVLLAPRLMPRYDLSEFAQAIGSLQQRGTPVAHFGIYHGEYQFIGRLTEPLQVVHGPEGVLEWSRAHTNGAVVIRADHRLTTTGDAKPLAMQQFRSGWVYLWRSSDVAALGDDWYRALDASGRAD